MTANQIAYAESQTHAKAQAEEERHNQTMEDLSSRELELKTTVERFNMEWKSKQQDLDRQIATAKQNLAEAAQDWKQFYEAQVYALESDKQDWKKYYDSIQADLGIQAQNLKEWATSEHALYERNITALNEWETGLKHKEKVYDQTLHRLDTSYTFAASVINSIARGKPLNLVAAYGLTSWSDLMKDPVSGSESIMREVLTDESFSNLEKDLNDLYRENSIETAKMNEYLRQKEKAEWRQGQINKNAIHKSNASWSLYNNRPEIYYRINGGKYGTSK